jgi:hypothetical protein
MENDNEEAFEITNHSGILIHGSTGCTCCKNENIICGFFETHESALERAIELHDRKTVCSQYSANGIYTLRRYDYERLPDGRIIIGSHVFSDDNIYESGDIAEYFRWEGQKIDEIS